MGLLKRVITGLILLTAVGQYPGKDAEAGEPALKGEVPWAGSRRSATALPETLTSPDARDPGQARSWPDLLSGSAPDLLTGPITTLVDAPLSIMRWDRSDWATAFVLGSTTLTFMMPMHPSLDARLQDLVQQTRSPVLDVVFPHITWTELSYSAGAGILVITGVGLAASNEDLLDYGSILFDSMASAAMLHLAMKLTMGREGPTQGRGQGEIHGPIMGPALFPSGTPSGHSAVVWSAVGATVTYLDNSLLTAAGLAGCGYMTASLMYNNQHFVSDIIWGGPMGYFIGRWVARRRAEQPDIRERDTTRWFHPRLEGIIPWSDNPLGAQGLSLLYTW